MAKVLVYPVGQAPHTQEVDGLEDMQKIVGGYIEYVDLGALSQIPELEGYDLYCNEEGKLIGLPLNVIFPADHMMGDFFISKANEEGETISLTKEDIEKIVYQMEYNSNLVSAHDITKIKFNSNLK